MTTKLGFKEIKNIESMYYHPEKKVTISCHVDDPIVKSHSQEACDWFHDSIEKVLDCKSRKILSVDQPALHLKYVCEEMQLPIEDAVPIQVDAGAAMGFIHNTATVGRMKHIDLRESWIDIMRSKKLKYSRVAGTDNPADFFTKIIVGPSLRKVEKDLMMQGHSN